MKVALKNRIKKVKLVIFDVDGVLTNGKINVGHDGKEFKVFDVQDGLGIVVFHKAGYQTAIISARGTKAVLARAEDLGIPHVHLKAFPKIGVYEKLIKKLKIKDEEVCFMGDDLTDLCILKRVGLAVGVANARDEIKDVVHYVTKNNGGDGAVREVIEMILKVHGKWNKILKEMF